MKVDKSENRHHKITRFHAHFRLALAQAGQAKPAEKARFCGCELENLLRDIAMPTLFEVRAHAGKGGFSALLLGVNPPVVRVGIPEKPEKGRANRALVLWLKGLLGCRVDVVSGHRARKKRLAAACTGEELVSSINAFSRKKGEKNGKDIR